LASDDGSGGVLLASAGAAGYAVQFSTLKVDVELPPLGCWLPL
jgi:hypothetical protein